MKYLSIKCVIVLKYILAYTYGSDLIPFGIDDELQSRYLSEKKLEVLAFTKYHNVPPYIHNGDQAHVVMGVDECVSVQY